VGVLYLVATPIGNMEDISLRALRVLREVGLVAAEDTRRTRNLLSAYGIKTRLTSYHQHNRRAKQEYLLNQLRDKDVALVCNAGMPLVSDPGYELVVAAVENGIPVTAVPGASVLPVALVVSGLPTDQFVFVGFLPARKGQRIALLEGLATERRTIVALEAPHRLLTSLQDMARVLGDRRIAVVRELTKVHEEVFRGTVNQAIQRFQEPRGEFTLVVEGCKEEKLPSRDADVVAELRRLKSLGISARECASRLSKTTGLSKKDLYGMWLALGNDE